MIGDSARNSAPWRIAAGVALATAGGAGALALANWLAGLGVGEPTTPLNGEGSLYAWTRGAVRYTVKGRGEPVVLLHGIYPGASSFEYRRVFDHLAERYRVFALDLLGFGQSERPAIDYTPALYVELIEDFLQQVVGATDQPALVIASGLSAGYAILAAANRPRQFSRLTLIEPGPLTDETRPEVDVAQAARRALLRSPLLGESLYNLSVSRLGLRMRLGSSVYSSAAAVSDDILDHYHTTAHQPGARFAPADARSGALLTPINDAFASLTVPTLLIWGRNDRTAPASLARDYLERRPETELRLFPTGSMPQEEASDAFLRELTLWLRGKARV
jgi:pimeloyl-ACP methyl ester carboxylesterase